MPTPISTTFYTPNTETAADLDATPTVSVIHVNGTIILPASTATAHSGTGTYTVTIPAQSLPAQLTVTWSGLSGGKPVTRVEYYDVIGRFMCELSEIRAMDQVSDTTAYPTSVLIAKRDAAEDLFEQITGPRTVHYRLDQMDGDATYRRAYMPVESSWVYEPNLSRRLTLTQKKPTTILSVGFFDTTQDAYVPDLVPTPYLLNGVQATQAQYLADNYFLYPSGEIERAIGDAGWPRGVKNVQVEYLYGEDDLPAALKDALLVYVQHLVLKTTSRVSPRATSITNEGGTVQLAQAHDWMEPTGISEVDAVLRRYDERAFSVA